MSDYNTINGTGENKSSSEERSPQMSSSPKTPAKDESPKAGDQKSPKKSPYKEELQKFLGKDKSPKVSVENTPEKDQSTPDKDETGEKSPKDFSDIVDQFDPDLDLSESFPEQTSSEILGEDTPEKDKSSPSFAEDIHVEEKSDLIVKNTTLDKDKSEKNMPELFGGDVEEECKDLLSPKPHLISKSTVPAENKVAKDKVLESPEKRKLRINRRGFHQQGASLGDSDVPKSEKAKSTVNLGATKKIISLSSVKSTSHKIPVDKDKKIIVLKRKKSLSIEEEEKVEPTKGAGDPPKKKHKPITWP